MKPAEGQSSEDASNNKDKEEQEIKARPLNMEDMRQAKSQVGWTLNFIQMDMEYLIWAFVQYCMN